MGPISADRYRVKEMCGIIGIINSDGRLGSNDQPDRLAMMLSGNFYSLGDDAGDEKAREMSS